MSAVTSPLGAVARGVAAGLVGTALMTAWQGAAARLQGSGDDASSSSDPWDDAPAPAQVARRVARGVFETDIPAARVGATTTIMHWSYGTGWGVVYGLVAGTRGRSTAKDGVLFGTAVWGMSYALLVPMGLYAAPWTYAPKELALDWSYHVAYGLGTGLGFAALAR